jgi:hypothetical protein
VNNTILNASLFAGKLNTRTLRLLWLLLSLILFVLSAGAPAGDPGHIG